MFFVSFAPYYPLVPHADSQFISALLSHFQDLFINPKLLVRLPSLLCTLPIHKVFLRKSRSFMKQNVYGCVFHGGDSSGQGCTYQFSAYVTE